MKIVWFCVFSAVILNVFVSANESNIPDKENFKATHLEEQNNQQNQSKIGENFYDSEYEDEYENDSNEKNKSKDTIERNTSISEEGEEDLEPTILSVIPIEKSVQPRVVSRVIDVPINTEEYTTVTSDNFPDPYPPQATNYEYTIGFGSGYGVEMIVRELDFSVDDYLVIQPGGNLTSERKILFSFFIKSEKKFKLLHLNEIFLKFVVANKASNKNKGFRIDFKQLGELIPTTTPVPTEPPPVIVAPLNESTIYIGGKTPQQFLNISETFKEELASIAEKYCTLNNITIDENVTISENVKYNTITRCNINWPESAKCVKIRYSIGVHFDNETGEYEMTVEHLDDMWMKHGSSMNLTVMGINIYHPPNDTEILWIWIGISIGVVLTFMFFIFVVWKYSCINDSGFKSTSMRESLVSQRKSDMSLFLSPHQTVPPLYGLESFDEFWPVDNLPPKYSGEKIEDSNFGARQNYGYVRDPEYSDLYSDEIIMSIPEIKEQDGFGIRESNDKDDIGESNL